MVTARDDDACGANEIEGSAMQQWEYRVVLVDYRGRISVEGEETRIGEERRTTFVRRFLDALGRDGWELSGIQPLSAQSAYYVLKRPAGTAAG
jgi:hypothetical protein